MMQHSKSVKFHYKIQERHWVGDGFNVMGLLRPEPLLNNHISPFILLDYAPPMTFESSLSRRGVGEHPHRGFETVTLALQGEIEHRDSSGAGGVIGAGDVQWMTAGSGVVHDEFHSDDFAKTGGVFEMIQLWVNLPAKDKMSPPKYQSISKRDIPICEVIDDVEIKVIAGAYNTLKGPASTFTDINIYQVESKVKESISLPFKADTNTIVLTLSGTCKINNQEIKAGEIVVCDRDGTNLLLDLDVNYKGVILNGAPIDEPLVSYGPFVMNTKEEIVQAMEDYQSGKMGKLD